MEKVLQVLQVLVGVSLVFGIGVMAFTHLRKSMVSHGVQIQCSSGDSEVMVFNVNFYEGEDEESKQAKVDDAFGRIEHRREVNHQKWLETKARAIAENEEKAAGDGKLRKLADNPNTKSAEFNGA